MKMNEEGAKVRDLAESREEITNIDEEMAHLFVRRMQVSASVAAYKKENGLPIYDPKREQENLLKGKERVTPEFRQYYEKFLQDVMDISKEYQKELLGAK